MSDVSRQEIFDFYIPERYRGKRITLPETSEQPPEHVELVIPIEACYLNINPLEDEEEFLGCQGDSSSQQLSYYDTAGVHICTQDLNNRILTEKLMSRLERLLVKRY